MRLPFGHLAALSCWIAAACRRLATDTGRMVMDDEFGDWSERGREQRAGWMSLKRITATAGVLVWVAAAAALI